MGAKPLDYLRAIADDRELTGSEKLVALMIMRHAGADGINSHPGAKLLAAETGLHCNTIWLILKSLLDKKWIILTDRGHGGHDQMANTYELNISVSSPNLRVGQDLVTQSESGSRASSTTPEASSPNLSLSPNALDLDALNTTALPVDPPPGETQEPELTVEQKRELIRQAGWGGRQRRTT